MRPARAGLIGLVAAAALGFAALRSCGEGPTKNADVPAAPAATPTSSPATPDAPRAAAPRRRGASEDAKDADVPHERVTVDVSRSRGNLEFDEIAGATVFLREPAGRERTATTGADGVAAFDAVPPGEFQVRASAPGHVPSEWSAGNRPVSAIVLERGVAVEGIILDAKTGRPVAGAAVELFGAPPLHGGSSVGEILVHPPIEDAEHFRLLGSATSGADGRFRADGVPAWRPLVVVARAEGRGSGRVAASAPGLDKPCAPIEVRVGATGTIVGRVLDAQGAPVAGALVGVVPATKKDEVANLVDGGGFDWRFGSPDRRIVPADGEGRFRIEGLPLDVVLTLVARGKDAPSPPADVQLTGERPERTIDLAVSAFGSVVVRVLRPDGTPAPDASANVETSHASWQDPATSTCHFDQIVPGTRGVTARAAGFPPVATRVDVKPGETTTLEVRLVAGLVLVGVLVDEKGAHLAAQTVRASGADGSWGQAATDAEGRFRIEGLAAGACRVEADVEGRGVAYADVEVVQGAPAARVVMRPNGRLVGKVTDAERLPAAKAWVECAGPVHRTAFADDAGAFDLRLPPGRYRVVVQTADKKAPALDVEVRAGEDAAVDLRSE